MLYTRNSIGVLSLILVPVLPLLSLLILHLLLHRLSYFLFDLGPDPRAITGTGNTSSDSLTKPIVHPRLRSHPGSTPSIDPLSIHALA